MKTKRSTKTRGTQPRLAAKKRRPASRRAVSRSSRNPIRAAEASIPPKWRWHYRTLLALRDRLLRDRSEKIHEAADAQIEPHSLHMADSATDEFDHDMALALLAAEQASLTDVEDAIRRLEAGTYGVCEATGVRIPAARLRAVPWTRYAREVEQRLEDAGAVDKPHVGGATSLRGSDEAIPEVNEFEQSEENEAREALQEAPREVTALEVRGEVSTEELLEPGPSQREE